MLRTGLFALLLGSAVVLPAFAADDVVLARVNDLTVTKAELERAAQSLPPQIKEIGLEKIYPQLLEEMIAKKLLIKTAYDADVQSRDDVKAAVKAATDDVVAEAYVNQVVAGKVTDDMLRKQYDEAVAKMPKGEEVNASHILVDSEDKAKELIKKIKGGEDFAKLAKESSTDKGSAEKGGELGWFRDQDMVPEFSKAAFALKKGAVTEKPVKSQFGYHVIKLVDRRPAQPPKFEEVKGRIEMQLGNKLAKDYIRELVSKAKVERFAMDGKTPLPAPGAPVTQ